MLELHGHLFSCYTWKPLIALYANETPFAFREIGPGHDTNNAVVHTAHPAGKFPVLVDGGTTIIEATAIIEYLAFAYPGASPLIPADRAMAVTARMLDRVCDNYLASAFQRIVGAYLTNTEVGQTPIVGAPDLAEVAAGKATLQRTYAWFENWLALNQLPEHVSLFTCSAAPALFYADWCDPIPADCTRLAALRKELLVLPPVARCIDDARPFRPGFPPGAPNRD